MPSILPPTPRALPIDPAPGAIVAPRRGAPSDARSSADATRAEDAPFARALRRRSPDPAAAPREPSPATRPQQAEPTPAPADREPRPADASAATPTDPAPAPDDQPQSATTDSSIDAPSDSAASHAAPSPPQPVHAAGVIPNTLPEGSGAAGEFTSATASIDHSAATPTNARPATSGEPTAAQPASANASAQDSSSNPPIGASTGLAILPSLAASPHAARESRGRSDPVAPPSAAARPPDPAAEPLLQANSDGASSGGEEPPAKQGTTRPTALPPEPPPAPEPAATRAPGAELQVSTSVVASQSQDRYAPPRASESAPTAGASPGHAPADSAQPPRDPAPTNAPQPQPGAPTPALRSEGQAPTLAGPDPSAAPPRPDTAPFTAFLSRGVGAVVRQGGGSLVLRLDPPSLGQITIRLQVDGGAMQAQFDASTPQAHRLLTENLSSLRATLEARGMLVDRLEVAARSAGAAHQPTAHQPAEPGGAATQASRAEPDADSSQGQNRGLRDGRSETGRRDEPHDHGGRGASPRHNAAFDERLRLTFSATA